MVSRFLMRHKIEELEQLFAALKTDTKTLKALEEELGHRQTPRAVALLAQVHGALKILKGAKSASISGIDPKAPIVPVAKKLNQQPDLWRRQSTLVPPKPAVAQQVVLRPVNRREPSIEASAHARDVSNATDATRGMSVDEAYKILKATSCSTWETIEQTRRQVVQQSHPERVATLGTERYAWAEAEAKRVNAAYAVLRQLRTATFNDV